MKYPKEYLEEIKTRLKVSNVVSKSVNLKKRGKEFVGLSPFKTEKTPSFTVNDEKGFYHCFSTAEHGNIFDFIMKTQNFKFGEAVKYLANLVREVVNKDVNIKIVTSNDDRSYHISSKKIKKTIGFDMNYSIKDAIKDLTNAFNKKVLDNPLDNEMYFNIKRMKSLNLK